MNAADLWKRYQQHRCRVESLGLSLDISRMMFDDKFLSEMEAPMQKAFDAIEALEKGGIANPDENRMVGHYWLRNSELSPTPEIRAEIEETVEAIKTFAGDVQDARLTPQKGDAFYVCLIVGIGGSALGGQFLADALYNNEDPMLVRFIDNTDPAGIDRVLGELADTLPETMTIVISKSGGTKETRNGMLEVRAAYERASLDFAKHAVAVTGEGSALEAIAMEENWIRIFPMWDWVGGRTSVMSAVGLLPAALQWMDIDGLLEGAKRCDEATRSRETARNPAALMALMWYYAGEGRGSRDMVVLPYADSLGLLSRYLQQLIMESLGKKLDRDGKEVWQGLSVYGNKGSTDQHAFVQQLRDGLNNFFVTFVEVLNKRDAPSMFVEDDATAGDYLHGFLHGTRAALYEQGRESMTITLNKVNAQSVGALIALFDRAVGLYAELININAYHQPGVEAGKKAAGVLLDLQRSMLVQLRESPADAKDAEKLAAAIGEADRVEDVHHLLAHLQANGRLG